MSRRVKFNKEGLWVNEEKVLPICGEFHYWRVDPCWWDDILSRLMKGAEMSMVASYIPWSVHEPIRGDFDFTGRRNPRANLKGFLDLVHKNGLYFVARSGPICLGEIDGGGPTDYANLVGGRTDRFLELTEAWVEAISSVWKEYSVENGGPLILVQVDNEIGANNSHLKKFLQQKYPSIEALNQVWDRNYSSFDKAADDEAVYTGRRNMGSYVASVGANWKSCLDIMEYKTRYFPRQYTERLVEMFKKYGTDVPLFTNNTFLFMQDWYELQKAVEFVGLDHYAYYLIPGDSYYWDYIYVSLNCNVSHFPWSPEFQCGSGMMGFGPATSQHQRMVTLFSLAAGMPGINYYMFVERERWEGYCPVTENGKVREEWFAHRQMFRILKEVDWPSLHRQCSLGLLWVQEHYWQFLYQGGGIIQPDDYTVVGSKDYGHLAQEPFWFYTKTLIDTDTDFEVVDVRTDLSKYPLLIWAAPPLLDAPMQQKLVDYVKEGGKLLFLSPAPHLDVEQNPYTVLVDRLGLGRGKSVDVQATLKLEGKSIPVRLVETYAESDMEPLFSTAEGLVPAGRKTVGKGQVYQIGFSALEPEVWKEILKAVGASLYVQSDNPLIHTSLHANEEQAVIIAINRGEQSQQARLRVFPQLPGGKNPQAEEMFTRKRLEIGPQQMIALTVAAKEVALIRIKSSETSSPNLDKGKLIQGYF
ncbi:MAG: beta-galactosidase, partial [Candidatus Latescibacteria bacterium]|nr:beta-galactosidase [Candidatus Latescibacterota bacterium]